MSKYHSKKVKLKGETFDSKKEMNRWCELKLLERAGKIADLQRQVKFELLPAQYRTVATKTGQKKKCIERAVSYIADFVYKEQLVQDGDFCVTVVEDTKGFRTADYIIKRKLLLYMHDIRIREV
jgi:hypothetical protein